MVFSKYVFMKGMSDNSMVKKYKDIFVGKQQRKGRPWKTYTKPWRVT